MHIPFKTNSAVHLAALDKPIDKFILLLLLAILPAGYALSDMACFPGSQELRDPPTIEEISMLETDLMATDADKCANGYIYNMQSYVDAKAGSDSRPVGPAYILHTGPRLPGPVLKVNFTNNLAKPGPYDCDHHSPDVRLCTNLHTHGLHVSPSGDSDNVLLTLKPGDKQPYQFDMPNNHAPGTHWMHAHLHGSTAPQLQNGMAGALILKGEIDEWLAGYGIQGEKDKIMILQQLLTDGNPICGKDPDGKTRTTSINGQCLPKINVREGEVQHWRLIHAGISGTVSFTVETAHSSVVKNIGFFEYARDGINLGRAIEMDMARLQPGYRSDILIQFPPVEDVCPGQDICELHLVDGPTPAAQSLSGYREGSNVMATVMLHRSSDAPMTMPPADDLHFAKPYPEIADSELLPEEKKIYFAIEPDGRRTVNGEVYPNGETIPLRLNTAQTWRLWVGAQSDKGNHPFHIHVNPFEVIIRDKQGRIIDRYWKDTLLVSGVDNNGEAYALEIRSRYETFDGEFVLHCHNLFHEDAGMMRKVNILPPLPPPPPL